jgi:hypothetical protein
MKGTLARWTPKTVGGRAGLVGIGFLGFLMLTLGFRDDRPSQAPQAASESLVSVAKADTVASGGATAEKWGEPNCRIDWGKKVCDGETRPVTPAAAPKAPEPRSEPVYRSTERYTLPPPGSCSPTYANFKRLRVGMAVTTIQDILGCEGKLDSEVKIGTDTFRSYSWAGKNWFSAVSVTANRSNRSTSITQVGLE